MQRRNFIGGAWADSGERLSVTDPATEAIFTDVAAASPADVGQAGRRRARPSTKGPGDT